SWAASPTASPAPACRRWSSTSRSGRPRGENRPGRGPSRRSRDRALARAHRATDGGTEMKGMTILVPLDGSPVAEAALRYAMPIALATRSSLRLLSVAERESGGMGNWPDEVHTYLEHLHMEDAHAYLTGIAASLQERDVPAEVVVTLGEPSAEI